MTEPIRTSGASSATENGNRRLSDASPMPIPEAIVDQAIAWYARLASGMETGRGRAEFARWHDAHPDHARAWARLEGMKQRFQGERREDPAALPHVTPTLLTFFSRRKALKRLAWAGVIGVGLDLVNEQVPWRRPLIMAASDAHTPIGGRRSMVLPDGTQLQLNTDTSLDLHFDGRERRILLRRGEILVTTSKDAAGRPFVVTTADGDLVPVGTRFTARYVDEPGRDSFTRLVMVDGAVQVRNRLTGTSNPLLVEAGHQVRFTREAVDAVAPADGAQLAWIDGMFAAESLRLDAFLAELGRYRAGWLRCSPDVAALRITGVWPLDGADATDRILDSVARRLPVRIRRFTPYFVAVNAA
jgi:transmembrane sensor